MSARPSAASARRGRCPSPRWRSRRCCWSRWPSRSSPAPPGWSDRRHLPGRHGRAARLPALALIALCAVAVAENARIPVDNPATHLELTMVHEAMILEASGRHLALWEAASALKLTLWLSLIAAAFLPFGTAPAGFAPLGWVVGLAAWLAKMALLCLMLASFESAIAKMRVFRVPEFIGVALLLGLLGAILLFVSTRLA